MVQRASAIGEIHMAREIAVVAGHWRRCAGIDGAGLLFFGQRQARNKRGIVSDSQVKIFMRVKSGEEIEFRQPGQPRGGIGFLVAKRLRG